MAFSVHPRDVLHGVPSESSSSTRDWNSNLNLLQWWFLGHGFLGKPPSLWSVLGVVCDVMIHCSPRVTSFPFGDAFFGSVPSLDLLTCSLISEMGCCMLGWLHTHSF